MTDVEDAEDVLALTPMQAGILAHSLLSPASSAFHLQVEYVLDGTLDDALLERAWRSVVERHEALRTSFVWERVDIPSRVVHGRVDLPLVRHDLRDVDGAEQTARLESIREQERRGTFDLTRAPLMRVVSIAIGERRTHLVWTFHHVVLDGQSAGAVLRDLWQSYADLVAGRAPAREPPPPHRSFADWQHQDLGAAEAYWRKRLDGAGAPVRLSIDEGLADAAAPRDDLSYARVSLPR
ncbi:MAG: condensation domain-containing protein, partial [Planctomycetota bacterium]